VKNQNYLKMKIKNKIDTLKIIQLIQTALNDRIILLLKGFILLLIVQSCENKNHNRSIIGKYENLNIHDQYYNSLVIRTDSTYTFCQSLLNNNKDFLTIYRGKWNLQDDKLILYQGKDLENYFTIEKVVDCASDSLKIKIDPNVFQLFPNLKVSIADFEEKDIQLHNLQITLLKESYVDNPKKQLSFYNDFLVSLVLRQGNYFVDIGYAFRYESILISMKDTIFKEFPDVILLEYKLKDSVLTSTKTIEFIEPNKLKKQ